VCVTEESKEKPSEKTRDSVSETAGAKAEPASEPDKGEAWFCGVGTVLFTDQATLFVVA